MQINLRTLLRLPVYTESGGKIGRVQEVVVNSDSHAVRHYQVGKLTGERHLVAPSQVRSITAERMTVVDSLLAETARKKSASMSSSHPHFGGALPTITGKS